MKARSIMNGLRLILASTVAWTAGMAAAQSSYQPPPARQPQPMPAQAAPPAPVDGPLMLALPAAQVQQLPAIQQDKGPVIQVQQQPTIQVEKGPVIQVQGQAPPPAHDTEAVPTDNAAGRQEPAVSIEWTGPTIAKVGQPLSYQLVVKNISLNTVQDVVIRSQVPAGAKVIATEPKAVEEGNALIWHIGTMDPRQEKRLDMQMVAETTGNIVCQASVTLTGSSQARIRVYQPKLVLKTSLPEKVIVGDPATVMVTVTNPGDASAEHVKITANLPDGLEHAKGKKIEFDLGNLAPKESRSVQVFCSAKGEGPQKCDVEAVADPSLVAQDSASVEVLVPHVEVALTGPGLRYLDRHAILNFKVTNPGTASATHVTLVDQVPPGFKFLSASGDGRHDFVSRNVTWSLGDLGPGQTQEVTLELIAAETGDQKHHATVTAARGLKAECETVTRVEGLPALLMELVDLDDPLEVGAETSYEIRVTNTGTKTETNLQLTCTVPEKMEFRGAKGAAGMAFKVEGKEVIFEPLPKLAPRADAVFRVFVRGMAPGDLRFRARIKADGLTEPVLKEESTKVYGDDAVVPK